ncbi:hypothetical protein Tco_1167880 [Tanacetum coccineum]
MNWKGGIRVGVEWGKVRDSCRGVLERWFGAENRGRGGMVFGAKWLWFNTAYLSYGYGILKDLGGYGVSNFMDTVYPCLQFLLDMAYWESSPIRCIQGNGYGVLRVELNTTYSIHEYGVSKSQCFSFSHCLEALLWVSVTV